LYEFTVQCPICSTRQDVGDDQIGDTIRCPDCHSDITVRKPHKRHRRAPGSPEEGDELRLEPPIEGSAPNVPMLPTGDISQRKTYDTPGQDALKRAEQERAEQERADLGSNLPPPSRGGGILRFLFEPSMVARWILLGLGIQAEASAIFNAIVQSTIGSPMEQFFGLALTVFSVVFGCFLALFASVAVLTVLRDTANGHELISDWPAFDFVDWILDSFNIVVSLFVAVFLGVALALPFGLGGGTVYLLGTMLCCGLSLALLFPLMLLSALDGGSPIHLFASSVWGSVQLARDVWLRFLVVSLLLQLSLVAIWQLRYFQITIVNCVASTASAIIVLLWFRTIGQLYRASQIKVSEAA
jgi:DNA-directed RNA polymerase subunit RPC12/RpoP